MSENKTKSERFFPRRGVAIENPTPVDLQARRRLDAVRQAKTSAHRLLRAISTMHDFDNTDQAAAALKHVITRGDQLMASLGHLRDVSKPFVEKQEGSK